MSHPPYIELGTRSAFSFLEGASLPEDLVTRAAELEHGTLALADRHGFYGAPRFFKAAQQAGLRALVGARLTLLGSGWARRKSDPPPAGGEILLLVRSPQGYRNLSLLLTHGHARYSKPHCRVTLEDLRERADGLIALVREPRLARSLERGGTRRACRVDRLMQPVRQPHRLQQVDALGAEAVGLPAAPGGEGVVDELDGLEVAAPGAEEPGVRER